MPRVTLTIAAVLLFALSISAQSKDPVSGSTAVIETTAGNLTCHLFDKAVPNAVANFTGLATGSKEWLDPMTQKPMRTPLYNGTIFHRVIPNFMVQGGDPTGTGNGSPGFSIADEIVTGLDFDRAGRLAYANSGPNTNGSQFFITELPTPHLNGHYVIFGQCDAATVKLVKAIARRARDERNDRPFDPVRITKVVISKTGAATAAAKPKPAASTAKKRN